jgi:hypothetical protein
VVADYVIALALCRRLSARRFEGETLIYVADVERASGRRFEALKLLYKALAISRENGDGVLRPRDRFCAASVAGASPRSLGLGVGTAYRRRSGADIWEMSDDMS